MNTILYNKGDQVRLSKRLCKHIRTTCHKSIFTLNHFKVGTIVRVTTGCNNNLYSYRIQFKNSTVWTPYNVNPNTDVFLVQKAEVKYEA